MTENSHGGSVAFDIQKHQNDGAIVLFVSGDVDMLTAPRINDAVLDALLDEPAAVIVDLSQVDFLASAGMTALVTAQQHVVPAAQFLVVADGRATSRPMKLMGIDATIALYQTLDDALVACREEPRGQSPTDHHGDAQQ